VPNIGSIEIPQDKSALKAHLLHVLDVQPWQTQIPEKHLRKLGLETRQ
jgi:hypothetical protein